MPSAGEKHAKPSRPHLNEEQVRRLNIIKHHLESIKREAAAGTLINHKLIEAIEQEIALLESWID